MTQPSLDFTPKLSPRFDGATVEPEDQVRLANYLVKVVQVMSDGEWWTLRQLADRVGCSESSASARLRDLKKRKFGSWNVEKDRVAPGSGLWKYRLIS